jgi:hypothetical protein
MNLYRRENISQGNKQVEITTTTTTTTTAATAAAAATTTTTVCNTYVTSRYKSVRT